MKFRDSNIVLIFTLLFVFNQHFSFGKGVVNLPSKYEIKTVVIDAGHGGKDPGCLGSISKEKDVALSIALNFGKLIEKNFAKIKVVYTRSTDEFIELNERAAIANRHKADLFISIHCNANTSPTAYGTETYLMGLHKSEGNLNVAKRENSVVLLEDNYSKNYDGFDPNSPQSHIIFALYQNAFIDQSISLASKIEKQFRDKIGRSSNGVKQAGFLVLWKTSMPSILIETGFLTNKTEEKFMISKDGQEQLANAIFNAFNDYKDEMEGNNKSKEGPSANNLFVPPASASAPPPDNLIANSSTKKISESETNKPIVKKELVNTPSSPKTETSSSNNWKKMEDAEAKLNAELNARKEAENKAEEEFHKKEEKEKTEAEAKIKAEEEKKRKEAESLAKKETEEKKRIEAEEKARLEEEKRRKEEAAKIEAEEKAKKIAEEKTKADEERLRILEEVKIKKESEEKAKKEAEEKAKADAVEAKTKRQAEVKAKKEEEAKAKAEELQRKKELAQQQKNNPVSDNKKALNINPQNIEVVFKIQIAAEIKKVNLNSGKFSKFKKLIETEKQPDESYKYLVGRYSDLEEAKNQKEKIIKRNFNDAFVVAYIGNKRVTIAEALAYKSRPFTAPKITAASIPTTSEKYQGTTAQSIKSEKLITSPKNQMPSPKDQVKKAEPVSEQPTSEPLVIGKSTEPEPPPVKKEKIIYRVQLESSNKKIKANSKPYKDLQNIEVEELDGKFNALFGKFPKLEVANKLKDKMIKDGFENAEVVAYNKSGERIDIPNDAIEELKTKQNTTVSENKSEIVNKEKITYKVQLESSDKKLKPNSKQFNDLSNVEIEEEDGMFNAMIGKYSKIELANKQKDKMVKDGFDEAIVVAYNKSGEKISLVEAAKITESLNPSSSEKMTQEENPMVNKTEEKTVLPKEPVKTLIKTGEIIFKIQLTVSEDRLDLTKAPYVQYKNIETEKTDEGSNKYLYGQFSSLDPANKQKDKMKKEGFPNATVVAYKDGIKIPLSQAIQKK